jgi:hypothetical protein
LQPLRVTKFFLNGSKNFPSKDPDGNATDCRRQNTKETAAKGWIADGKNKKTLVFLVYVLN